MTTHLYVGAGYRTKPIVTGLPEPTFITTLDINPDTEPTYLHDLDKLPYPVESESADVIWASQVLEHCGRQGDWKFFFAQFSEFHRILKPEGLFVASVPAPGSAWVWADPGHTRTITPETLMFLDQNHYATQVGVSPSSDYRSVWKGNLKTIWWNIDENHFTFVLRKTAPGALEDTQNSQEGKDATTQAKSL